MNFTKLFCFFIRQIRAFLWNNNKVLLREGQSEGEGTLRIEAEWYLIKQVWYSWYIQMNPRHTRSWIIAHCLCLLHCWPGINTAKLSKNWKESNKYSNEKPSNYNGCGHNSAQQNPKQTSSKQMDKLTRVRETLFFNYLHEVIKLSIQLC